MGELFGYYVTQHRTGQYGKELVPGRFFGKLFIPHTSFWIQREGTSQEAVERQLQDDLHRLANGLPVQVERGYYHTAQAAIGEVSLEQEQEGQQGIGWIGSIAVEAGEMQFYGRTKLATLEYMAAWLRTELVPLIREQVDLLAVAEKERLMALYTELKQQLVTEEA